MASASLLPAAGAQSAAPRPDRVVTAVGWLMAAWCSGFAIVNVVFELTGHFAHGALAAYAPGISVVDWTVVCLKLLGAAVALMTVTRVPGPIRPDWIAVLAWGAAALAVAHGLVRIRGRSGGQRGSIPMATSNVGIPTRIRPSTTGAPSIPQNMARLLTPYRRENDTASTPYPVAASRKNNT